MTIAEYEEIKYQARTLGLNDEQIKQLSSNLPDAIDCLKLGASPAQVIANRENLSIVYNALKYGIIDINQLPKEGFGDER